MFEPKRCLTLFKAQNRPGDVVEVLNLFLTLQWQMATIVIFTRAHRQEVIIHIIFNVHGRSCGCNAALIHPFDSGSDYLTATAGRRFTTPIEFEMRPYYLTIFFIFVTVELVCEGVIVG